MTLRTSTLSSIMCIAASPALAEVPVVVTDFGPTQAIVSRVMEGVGTPNALLTATDTPHSFAMRPSHARTLSNADIVVWIGAPLTPWLVDPIETVAEDAIHLELLKVDGWTSFAARSKHDHGHGDDDDHGDDHGDDHDDHSGHEDHEDHAGHDDHEDHDDHAGHKDHDDHAGHDDTGYGQDPHAWLDPDIAVIWATAVSDVLGAADPENANLYQDNAAQFAADVATLTSAIEAVMAEADGSNILFPHDSTQYFEARFDLTPGGFIAEGDAAEPGPAHIQELRARITAGEITCVLTDIESNPGTIRTLTEGVDVNSGMLDLTDSAGVGYDAMMRGIAQTIADCAS